ncbi:MAG: SpoIIE family protein phosphatase [Actinomycetota bacterium]
MATPVVVFVVVLGLYTLGGSLAWWTIRASGLGAVFFPPAGVTLVAFLALPRSRWPFVALAIVVGEVLTGMTAGGSDDLPSLLGFGLANLAEPLLGASLLGLALGRSPARTSLPDLGRRRELGWFVLLGVLVGPIAGGVIGGLTANWRFGTGLWPLSGEWWLGDALGVIVVAPLALAWVATQSARRWSSPGSLLLVAAASIGAALTLGLTDKPLMFMVLASLIAAGALFDVRTVALCGLVIAIVVGVALGISPDGIMSGQIASTALTILKLEFLVFAIVAYAVVAEANERMVMAGVASERLDRVGELQRLLLPPAEVVGDGFRVRGVYDAATAAGVGGDWYIARPTLDDRLVLAVGDIVGHDIDAARSMASVRSGLILDAASEPDPARLLARLDVFAEVEPSIRYSTAWVGVFDPATRVLDYACAGHLPPLLVTPDGRIQRLDGANTALVALPQGDRISTRIGVSAGAAIVMYTDGLVERRDIDLDEAVDRLVDTVAAVGIEPEAVLERMLEGSPRDDDTILAVVELTGSTSRPRLATNAPARRS